MVDCDFVLAQFLKVRKRAVALYEEFVKEWIGKGRQEKFYRVIDQRFLGDEDFIMDAKNIAGEETLKGKITLRDRSFSDIVKKVEKIMGVRGKVLRGRSRSQELTEARSLFVRLCLLYTSHKRKDIAKYLGRVPRIVSYLERQIPQEKWEYIQDKLKW